MFDGDVPGFNVQTVQSTFVSPYAKRYRHKAVIGRCVHCGQLRPGDCSCVVVTPYSYSRNRDYYQQRCAFPAVVDAFIAMGDSMIVAGDALKGFEFVVPDLIPDNTLWMVSQSLKYGGRYDYENWRWIYPCV